MTFRFLFLGLQALVLLAVGGIVALATFAAAPDWRALAEESQVSLRVGAPSNPMCCVKATYTPCSGGPCITLPNCPANQITNGSCGFGFPTCTLAPPNSICTTPSRTIIFSLNQCKTTGATVNCTTPAGTANCQITLLLPNPYVTSGCNIMESLCATQPAVPCE